MQSHHMLGLFVPTIKEACVSTDAHHEYILRIVPIDNDRGIAKAVGPLLRTMVLLRITSSDGTIVSIPCCAMVRAGFHDDIVMSIPHTDVRPRPTEVYRHKELTVAILPQSRDTIAKGRLRVIKDDCCLIFLIVGYLLLQHLPDGRGNLYRQLLDMGSIRQHLKRNTLQGYAVHCERLCSSIRGRLRLRCRHILHRRRTRLSLEREAIARDDIAFLH